MHAQNSITHYSLRKIKLHCLFLHLISQAKVSTNKKLPITSQIWGPGKLASNKKNFSKKNSGILVEITRDVAISLINTPMLQHMHKI